MIQTFEAKVIKLEHICEKGQRRSIYTLEYEENGVLRQATTDQEPSSWVDEDAIITITVEDGKLLRTSIKQATLLHNLMLIAFLLVCCAIVFGWAALLVCVKSNTVRMILICIGAITVLWIMHSS